MSGGRKHLRECRGLCEAEGLEVSGIERRSRHIILSTAAGPVVFPSTPGDRRWRHNARALVRRIARDLG